MLQQLAPVASYDQLPGFTESYPGTVPREQKECTVDIARCTFDNRIYSSREFSELPDTKLEELRVHLICDECKGPAFFRRRTRNGRAPCFGGRPHGNSCSYATAESGAWGSGGNDHEDERINRGDHIILDLRLDVEDVTPTAGGEAGRRRHGQGRTFDGVDGPSRAYTHRKLRGILRRLIRTTELSTSSLVFEVPNAVTLPANELFVPFDEISDHHIGQFHGYWGTLASAVLGREETIWLNTGGRGQPSIPIDASDLTTLLALGRVDDLEDLSGAYILVLGNLNVSTGSKLYIPPKGLSHIAILAH
jgi:hypothetical protein